MRDYAAMKGTDHPFARDGLTVDEICAMWRVSRKNLSKIVILAQLCSTTRNEICNLLVAKGYTHLPQRKVGGNQTIEGKLGEETPRVVEEIRRAAEGGVISMTQAAVSVGISRSALRTLCQQNGIVFHIDGRHAKEGRIETCRELAESGKDMHEVADAMGISIDTVRRYARRGGFKVKGMKKSRRSAI